MTQLSYILIPVLISFLVALFLTIIAEVPVAMLFGFRTKKDIFSIILINVITNPLANVLTILLFMSTWVLGLVVLEVLVILAEWWLLIYALSGTKQKLFWMSVSMNIASVLFGFFILFLIEIIF